MIDNGKATIEQSSSRLSIIVPSNKNWFALIFGTFWMGGWYIAFSSTFSELFDDSKMSFQFDGFLIFWLLMWTAGGVTVLVLLLWGYFGKEQFLYDRNEIYFNKTIFGVGIKKRLNAKEIKKIRLEVQSKSIFGNNRWSFWGLGSGKIKFDYGFKTYSYAQAVDDAEADHIIQLMKTQLGLLDN
jgi:hypothetical protein